jgi:hypothetical protein
MQSTIPEKCGKCFAPGVPVTQNTCRTHHDALELYTRLFARNISPTLCVSHRMDYRVCHEVTVPPGPGH